MLFSEKMRLAILKARQANKDYIATDQNGLIQVFTYSYPPQLALQPHYPTPQTKYLH